MTHEDTKMLDALAQLIGTHHEALEADLDHARTSLAASQEETRRWTSQVAGLEYLLDTRPADYQAEPRLPLHDAMVYVIAASPRGAMRAADLAAEIDRRGLYRMQDGRRVENQQIHARAGNYAQYFRKEGTFIGLTDSGRARAREVLHS